MLIGKLLGLRYVKPLPVAGKTVWIIGASSGLGRAFALQLAHDGAKVAVSARTRSALEALAQDAPPGAEIMAAPLDVTDMPSMQRAFESIVARWTRLDIVVYCSGVRPLPDWHHFRAAEQWDGMEVNFGGVLRMLEIMLPQWRAQGGGHLMLIGSLIATGPMPLAGTYGASKAALAYLAENLAMDLAPQRVTVQLASPGFIETPLTAFRPRSQMPFLMQPEEAASILRRYLLQPDFFEIHFPKRLSVPTRFARWILPRSWWDGLLIWLDRRSATDAAKGRKDHAAPHS